MYVCETWEPIHLLGGIKQAAGEKHDFIIIGVIYCSFGCLTVNQQSLLKHLGNTWKVSTKTICFDSFKQSNFEDTTEIYGKT